MNWHEWLETNELTRMNWNEWLEMKQLIRINWTEWMKLLNWHEWIETHELKQMTWHERIEMNDMKGMNCQEWPECEIELSLQSRGHSVDHSTTFPIEARKRGNRDLPAATAEGHCTRKNHRVFTPESVFKRELTRSRSLTLPNYVMMMWLTSMIEMMMWQWCGCHDGGTASHSHS